MIDFLQRLVKADSTLASGERLTAEVVAGQLAAFGIESDVDVFDGNRANITAHLKGSGEKGALVFVSHLDVVPPGDSKWSFEPFCGQFQDGRVLGRGATDMKGGLAAAAMALCETAKAQVKLKADVWFVATAGEETDSCGAARFASDFAAKAGPIAGIILPEPTGLEIITAHRGLFWLKVTTKGRTAHSSTPHLGINAITAMQAFLARLADYRIDVTEHPLLGGSTMSVNTITGGKAFNVVPDECTAGIDIRTLPGQDTGQILSDIEKMFKQCRAVDSDFAATVEIERQTGGLETDADCDFVRGVMAAVGAKGTEAARFTTDAPVLSALGAPIIVYGPGDGSLCHKPDEYIAVSDVERGVGCYRKVIERFCM